eukprot:g44495.t1
MVREEMTFGWGNRFGEMDACSFTHTKINEFSGPHQFYEPWSFQGHVTDEETEDGKLWRVFHIGEQEYRVDMAIVDPYKAVISHGEESATFSSTYQVIYKRLSNVERLPYPGEQLLAVYFIASFYDFIDLYKVTPQSPTVQGKKSQPIQPLLITQTFQYRYVIGTLELLVAENYIIVYLNGATTRNRVPSISWLKQCYQTIDR